MIQVCSGMVRFRFRSRRQISHLSVFTCDAKVRENQPARVFGWSSHAKHYHIVLKCLCQSCIPCTSKTILSWAAGAGTIFHPKIVALRVLLFTLSACFAAPLEGKVDQEMPKELCLCYEFTSSQLAHKRARFCGSSDISSHEC